MAVTVLAVPVAGADERPPKEDAGIWNYSSTVEDYKQRIAHFKDQILDRKAAYNAQLEQVAKLRSDLEAKQQRHVEAQEALNVTFRPVELEREKYQQAQKHSLENPEISTEKERQAYQEIKTALQPEIDKKEAALREAREAENLAQEALEAGETELAAIFHHVEDLQKRLEVLGEMVVFGVQAE
ncbi:MAG: hypothetical protein H7831_00045 [Magnetococcus sp. WYHC-3]